MMQVVEVNAIEHLEAIRLRWTSLLYQTPGASFFHTLDWLQVYWQHVRQHQRLRVLLVYRSGTVIGILPLVVREETTAAGPADVLTYPTINPTHFSGPIGPNPTATLMASFRHLAGRSRDWDLLSLGSIGEHDRGRTANALELAGFCARKEVHATVAKVCFDASRSDLPVRWPSKAVVQSHRRASTALAGHRTKERESEPASEMTFERIRPLDGTYEDDQSLEDLVKECFSLNVHVPSESSPESSPSLLRDAVSTASRLGMLDLSLLRLDGRLIAYSINVHFDGVIQQIRVGGNAASLDFLPTDGLARRMVQDSMLRQDRCIYLFDSCDGLASFRGTQQVPLVRYQYRASTPLHERLREFGHWLMPLEK
ncbi:MAG: GNAT family N-acetyltransferase [Planctomycetota bacterium]